ncbi:Ppx/GppA phosphatase family protein [Rhabdochromatium marinum]|uniref:Ppx/GppA phosphatase family protein n=1 Tax=Rhabdochromatium marinum TaxID=48729 RepID=UPI0019089C0B|nr:Ppx/GppA phosphatase family protein [Rhabdochromatium marinum]MBK1647550.1 exopolyphosphatase [Rhabdochromatium marinum]
MEPKATDTDTTPAPSPSAEDSGATFAALDLGSNSFHLLIARSDGGTLKVMDRYKEMVRLGEGLTPLKTLEPEVAERALACLERIGQRLRALPPANVRVVGTNTLRQLRETSDFLPRAEAALGQPIEVIAGREEARLVYLGVAHGLAIGDEKRLVIDIGGGSTELIVGHGFNTQLRESLHMGCVSMSRRFFADGRISLKAMDRAELAAAMQIRPVRELFRQSGWETATGSSGTIKAIASVLTGEGWCSEGVCAEGLTRLREALIDCGKIDDLRFKGLSDRRRPVFTGGVAVLRALFQNLAIDQMRVSNQALREGVIYELIGRTQQEDVRERTVVTLCRRFDVDLEQAQRVKQTALRLYQQIRCDWQLERPEYLSMLGWAAQLHEIGLAVSHSQYQKHGAYLLRNADLSGFTRQEQTVLAILVLAHRRKMPEESFANLPENRQDCARRLCVLLRLAVLIHRGRSATTKPNPMLSVKDGELSLCFPNDWLATHPLTRLELEEESERLRQAGIELRFY